MEDDILNYVTEDGITFYAEYVNEPKYKEVTGKIKFIIPTETENNSTENILTKNKYNYIINNNKKDDTSIINNENITEKNSTEMVDLIIENNGKIYYIENPIKQNDGTIKADNIYNYFIDNDYKDDTSIINNKIITNNILESKKQTEILKYLQKKLNKKRDKIFEEYKDIKYKKQLQKQLQELELKKGFSDTQVVSTERNYRSILGYLFGKNLKGGNKKTKKHRKHRKISQQKRRTRKTRSFRR